MYFYISKTLSKHYLYKNIREILSKELISVLNKLLVFSTFIDNFFKNILSIHLVRNIVCSFDVTTAFSFIISF